MNAMPQPSALQCLRAWYALLLGVLSSTYCLVNSAIAEALSGSANSIDGAVLMAQFKASTIVQEMAAVLRGYDCQERQAMISFYLGSDLFFPLLYAIALPAVLHALYAVLGLSWGRWKLLLFLPVVGAVCDLIENFSILSLLRTTHSFTAPLSTLETLVLSASILKWVILVPASLISLAAMLALLILLLFRCRRGRAATPSVADQFPNGD